MRSILSILGLDPASRAQRRANALAKADLDFIGDLVRLRKAQSLTQQQVAERLGVAQSTVASFENYDNDPKLSTIRRYAQAIEALVAHAVVHDDGQLMDDVNWVAAFTLTPTNATPLADNAPPEIHVSSRSVDFSLAA